MPVCSSVGLSRGLLPVIRVCCLFFLWLCLSKILFWLQPQGNLSAGSTQWFSSRTALVELFHVHSFTHILICCFNSKDSRRRIPSLPLAARRLICYLDLQFSSIVHGVLWMLDDGKVHFFQPCYSSISSVCLCADSVR